MGKNFLSLMLIVIVITFPDGSAYIIDPTRTDGKTWVWSVYQIEGKDLSHWVLDLGPCADRVVSTDPSSSFGTDPTTGATGYKFEPIVGRITQYTVTLDSIYAHGHVTATMKAGQMGNYASRFVTGPECSESPQATATPTATGDGGTIPPLPTVTPTPTGVVTGEGGGTEPARWRQWFPWGGKQ